MDDIRNSSGLLPLADWCLICCSAYPEGNLSNRNPQLSTASADTNYERNRVTKATEKIFQYLLIPKEHLQKVKSKCHLSFCPNCMSLVEEIIQLQKKVELLELQIQCKVETLGKMAIETPAEPSFTVEESRGDEKEVAEIFKSFKTRVTRNFREGLLPNPSVKLRKANNKEELSPFVQKQKDIKPKLTNFKSIEARVNRSSMEQQSYTCTNFPYRPSSDCNISEEDTEKDKTETAENVIKVEAIEIIPNECVEVEDDHNSNDRLFEVVTILDDIGPGGLTGSQPKRRKLENTQTRTRPPNIRNSFEKPNPPPISIISRDLNEQLNELQGLIQGQDYFKCTKCDFYVIKTPSARSPSRLKRKLAIHYRTHHNPELSFIQSKTIIGNDCYKCIKCGFLIVFQSENRRSLHHFRLKLSLHCMDVHDASEAPSNSLTFLPQGIDLIDYFSCPSTKCTFVAGIKKEQSQLKQLINATEARIKIIEHYKTSPLHIEERKATLANIAYNPSLEFEDGGVTYYKCTKCDFKSLVAKYHKQLIPDPRGTARKALTFHFLNEHVFPWEIFPGLYKYGCYLEEYEDGCVLKCPYSGCDYFTNVEYDLEQKTEEECELAAHQSFFDSHALSHNYNSIGLDDNQLSALPAEEGEDFQRFPIESQTIQLNEEGDNNSVTTTKDRHIRGFGFEEVTLNSEMLWLGDYEEVEEFNFPN